jgi:hypothetical protein
MTGMIRPPRKARIMGTSRKLKPSAKYFYPVLRCGCGCLIATKLKVAPDKCNLCSDSEIVNFRRAGYTVIS